MKQETTKEIEIPTDIQTDILTQIVMGRIPHQIRGVNKTNGNIQLLIDNSSQREDTTAAIQNIQEMLNEYNKYRSKSRITLEWD